MSEMSFSHDSTLLLLSMPCGIKLSANTSPLSVLHLRPRRSVCHHRVCQDASPGPPQLHPARAGAPPGPPPPLAGTQAQPRPREGTWRGPPLRPRRDDSATKPRSCRPCKERRRRRHRLRPQPKRPRGLLRPRYRRMRGLLRPRYQRGRGLLRPRSRRTRRRLGVPERPLGRCGGDAANSSHGAPPRTPAVPADS